MLEVYLNDKKVFEGTEDEVDEYCENNEYDYVQDPSYANFEKLCGIYN